jgi:hypothetical protein
MSQDPRTYLGPLPAPAGAHQHPGQHALTGNGAPPLPPPSLQSIVGGRTETRVMDVFETITEGVPAYRAKVGDRIFVFDRRPSARQQLKAISSLGTLQTGQEPTPENLAQLESILEGLVDVLKVMCSDPTGIDDLLDVLDLEGFASLTSTVLEQVTVRPTTESSDSSASAPPMTSTTGSPAQDSPAAR